MADSVATLVVKIVSDVKGATSGMDEVTSRSSKMKKGLAVAGAAGAAVLAGMAAGAISAANAAAEDAQSQALLAQALQKTAGASDAQIQSTEDWISKMSAATGVADDQMRPALATLARATGDVTKSQDGLKAALDVSAATGADVESVSKAIAKAYGGQTTSLGKLVPGLDKAVLASGDMTAIMAELASKTGGAAAVAAETTAGKMARMKVSMDEAKESLGAGLLPIMGKAATVLARVGQAIQDHPRLFQAIAIAVAAVAAALVIMNIALAITAALTSPITLIVLAVVAAIALLVAIIIIVVKHWDDLSRVAGTAWNAIKSGAKAAAAVVVAMANKIKNAFMTALNWVKSNWPKILAILTGPIGVAVLLIVKNWDKIKDAIGSTKDKIQDLINKIKDIHIPDSIKNAIDKVKTAVGDVITKVGELITKIKGVVIPNLAGPFNLAKTAIDHVIGAVQSLIGWLGRIHIPKISLPHIPGTRSAATAVVPDVGGFASPRVATAPAATSTRSTGSVVINVNGAIDPEATARQIRRILAGHERRVGVST